MFAILLRKLSSLFFKIHLWLDRRVQGVKSLSPYHVKSAKGNNLPRIVHVNANFVIGGSSQLIVDLIERTSAQFDHLIIVPEIPRPLPYEPLDVHGFSLKQMERLYQFLKKQRPALVHIHYWVRHYDRYRDFALWYQAIFRICEELRLPVIQNINVPANPFPSPAVKYNVFVSEYVRKHFNDQPGVYNKVIYPGSDLAHFTNEAIEKLPADNIGMVYRLDPDKLDEQAIDPFIRIASVKKNVTCYIIGGGAYLKQFKQRVSEAGLDKQIVFTGYIAYDELPVFYRKMSIVLAPVHDESFGQVTPFAMGMGLAVAGYDTGALAEILGTRETLVPTGDVEALSGVVLELLNDPERRIRIGRRNRQRARKLFGIEQMVQQYQELYSKILARQEEPALTIE